MAEETHVHECGNEGRHSTCCCVICGELYPNRWGETTAPSSPSGTVREEFEAQVRLDPHWKNAVNFLCRRDDKGDYVDVGVEIAWIYWQAAYEAGRAEMAELQADAFEIQNREIEELKRQLAGRASGQDEQAMQSHFRNGVNSMRLLIQEELDRKDHTMPHQHNSDVQKDHQWEYCWRCKIERVLNTKIAAYSLLSRGEAGRASGTPYPDRQSEAGLKR